MVAEFRVPRVSLTGCSVLDIGCLGLGFNEQVASNPTNTVFDAKRLIGRRFDDPIVQAGLE